MPATTKTTTKPRAIQIKDREYLIESVEVGLKSDAGGAYRVAEAVGADAPTCTCPAFEYSKSDPKTCKHILALREAGLIGPAVSSRSPRRRNPGPAGDGAGPRGATGGGRARSASAG